MKLGTPPQSNSGDWKPPKKGIYECIVKSFSEIPNPFFNPDEDNENKKTQIKWLFTVVDGENKGFDYWYFTGSSLGRHSRNKLTNLLKIIYPDFDLDNNTPKDEDELRKNVIYRPLRIVADVKSVVKKMDDGTTEDREYGRVVDIWESERKTSRAEVEAMLADMGATVLSEEVPY